MNNITVNDLKKVVFNRVDNYDESVETYNKICALKEDYLQETINNVVNQNVEDGFYQSDEEVIDYVITLIKEMQKVINNC